MAERRRVVDAHVHFWDPSALHYPWLESAPALHRAYLPGDLESLSARTVDAVIFVEADCLPSERMDEVQFIERLAAADERIVGIVAQADMLDDGGRAAALEALSRRDGVVGVRQNIQGHDPGYSTHPSFVNGVRETGELGLTFDLCITADQLSEGTQLVRSCPGTQFVLDHCGKPAIRDDALDKWAADLACLAECSNVACKMSGLLTEARPDQWTGEALRPYMESARREFGARRLLYGSDWPVVNLAGSVAVWRGIVDALTAPWPDEDRDAFYAGNAMRIYGLEVQ
ncbi:amidohydrolase family protein [soil metagenome]